MLQNKAIGVIACFMFLILTCATSNNSKFPDEYALEVLEYASGDYRKASTFTGAMESLNRIKRESPNRIKDYIGLLDYYLGSGPGEILSGLILEEGTNILPDLRNKLAEEINCMPQFNQICIKDKATRNKRIRSLIYSIENPKE